MKQLPQFIFEGQQQQGSYSNIDTILAIAGVALSCYIAFVNTANYFNNKEDSSIKKQILSQLESLNKNLKRGGINNHA